MDMAATPFDTREVRRALGTFATGVTIITTRSADGECVGLTVNSFSSVSLEPPLVLWSLSSRSPSLGAFERASHFGVNVLAADQVPLSQRFSSRIPDKFGGVDWYEGVGGVPLLAGASAHLECANNMRHVGGDHVVFIGHVERFVYEHKPPLVFCHGRYMSAADL
jgi:flavin reductase (DIM6/NTAB) family NADH-FMN oxidoreductase RutF